MVVAWWSIIPFVLLLGCIAVLPLIPATEKIWDRNLVKLIVASGGIFLVGDIKATPRNNTIFIVANCGGLLTPLGETRRCSSACCAASPSSGPSPCSRSGSS